MRLNRFLLIVVIFSIPLILSITFASDPLASKLRVDGPAVIGAGYSLRLKPVPANNTTYPDEGDLYYNGTSSALLTYASGSWQNITEAGDVFYRDSDATFYYYNNSTWASLGSLGPKTVATKIVAASNSLDTTHADYVCDGNGDQVEIQAAIDALGTTGGAVYLLEGTYNISADINLNNTAPDDSNKSIIGAGSGTVLKKTNASNVRMINCSNVSGILISQLTIDGNNRSGANNYGIYFNTVTYSKIDKVWVQQMNNSGIYLTLSTYNSICNNFTQFNQYGIMFNLTSNYNIVYANICQNNTGGIRSSWSNSNIYYGNNLVSNIGTSTDNSGIYFGNQDKNNIIVNNNAQSNSISGFQIANAANNNIIVNNNAQSNTLDGISVDSSGSNVISGNNLVSNTRFGINLVQSGSNNNISGNAIYDNGASSANGGININSNSDTNLISANSLYDSAGSGRPINIAANTCDNNYLALNQVSSWPAASAAIADSGTGTKFTDKTKMTLEQRQVNIAGVAYTLDPATNPRTYCMLNPAVNTVLSISNGKSAGDLLILENGSNVRTVTVNDGGNINLSVMHILGQRDNIELIWNGTRWLEMKYVDN